MAGIDHSEKKVEFELKLTARWDSVWFGQEVGDHLLKLTLSHTQWHIQSMYYLYGKGFVFCYFLLLGALYEKKIGQHHFLCIISYMPIPNIQVGGALSLPILRKNFVLAYMEKSGVSRLSTLISSVQRLIWKKIGQHQVAERMEIHMEQERWSHLLRPLCRFVQKLRPSEIFLHPTIQ